MKNEESNKDINSIEMSDFYRFPVQNKRNEE